MEAARQIQKAVRKQQSAESNLPSSTCTSNEMVSTKRSECVQVALVVRPLLSHEPPGSECLRQTEPGKPEVILDCAPFPFAFDHVGGPSSGVASVFEACVAPTLLPNVIRGCNATVLAYGQVMAGVSCYVCHVLDISAGQASWIVDLIYSPASADPAPLSLSFLLSDWLRQDACHGIWSAGWSRSRLNPDDCCAALSAAA